MCLCCGLTAVPAMDTAKCAADGAEVGLELRAAFDTTSTRMMTALLRNEQAGTEYA